MRRAHLITPFGVGSLSTMVNGVTVITASLDAWFHDFAGNFVAPQEMEVQDWRLQKRLKVGDLKLPPREIDNFFSWNRSGRRAPSAFIPVLRFPQWNKCQFCNTLTELPLSFSGEAECQNHDCRSRNVFQVSIVIACENGHLDDFPWRRWVHRDGIPDCGGKLKLISSGGGTLASQSVTCTGCSAPKRSLNSILGLQTLADGSQISNLSRQLRDSSGEYICQGHKPWANEREECNAYPVALLRTSSNVYFPIVESSIYIPQTDNFANPSLLELLNKPSWRIRLQTMRMYGTVTPDLLRAQDFEFLELRPYSDSELEIALREILPQEREEVLEDQEDGRISEFQLFCREEVPHEFLKVSKPKNEPVLDGILNLRRIDSLCETRALRGFTRITSKSLDLDDGKKLMSSHRRQSRLNWLPAYQVRGEGIFFELDPQKVKTWKNSVEVRKRIDSTLARVVSGEIRASNVSNSIDAGYFLIHTLSHLIIRQLVFDSGYGTASLRERLYLDATGPTPRYGVLIYTAAGDSEGTMGGLVSLAEGNSFELLFANALESARWCSTDPICLELGGKGQGPDLCNLAACHTCALLPETACEDMNKFLDRGLLIGTPDSPQLGFFTLA